VEDCLALAWNGETLVQLMERYPCIAFNMLDLVAGYYRWLLDRYHDLITKRVENVWLVACCAWPDRPARR
jgi:hypothetical protein